MADGRRGHAVHVCQRGRDRLAAGRALRRQTPSNTGSSPPAGSLLQAAENMRRLRPCASLLLAISLLLAWVLAYQHVKRMDGVWFQPSPAGTWALVQYLAGDYVGAARAYRTHYREAVASGWSSGDPALDALLAGDLDRAASAARTGTSGGAASCSTMGDIALERGRPDEAMAFPVRRCSVPPTTPRPSCSPPSRTHARMLRARPSSLSPAPSGTAPSMRA